MLRRHTFVLALASMAPFGCDQKKTETPPPSGGAAPAAAAPSGTAAAPSGTAAAPSGTAAAPSGAAAAPALTGEVGDVKGVVTVVGKLLPPEDLKRNSDAFCAQKQMKDEQIVADAKGRVANVLVHINGLPATPPPAEKASLSQDECMYRPRVLGVVAGQTLAIRNGDPVLHNVHTYEGARTLFNTAQVPGTPNIEKTFTQNGTMLKFKCDIHPWMTGYVWVQNNRYFAVTDKDGSFEIKDVPAGTWEIEAWHERFGTKTGKITVQKGKPAEIKLELATTTAAK
jgi:plastocyanin